MSVRRHTSISLNTKSAPVLKTMLSKPRFSTCAVNITKLHEVNTEPITKKRNAAGCKWGTFKDSDPDAADTASKVIRRHMEVKTPKFLYT